MEWFVFACFFLVSYTFSRRLRRLEARELDRAFLERLNSLEASKLLDGIRIRHLESQCCDMCRQRTQGAVG
jgi:hypothetical protein